MSVTALASASFSDRLVEFRDAVDYRRLDSPEDREQAFRLRYDAYVREGTIPIDPSKRFSDALDETDNVWVFGVFLEGRLASSIRVHVISPDYPVSPSLEVFPDVLGPEVDKGRIIVDPTRFVADRDLARRYPELPWVTVRLGFLASERFRADLGLASVRAEHQAFYRRLFQLKPLCEPRQFPNLAPTFVLMGVNYMSVREKIIARYPFMDTTPEELWALFDAGRDVVDAPAPEVSEPAEAQAAPANDYDEV